MSPCAFMLYCFLMHEEKDSQEKSVVTAEASYGLEDRDAFRK